MCFFVCAKTWERGVFGPLVLFVSYSAKEAWLSSLMSPPLLHHLSFRFTRSQTFLVLTVSMPSSKPPSPPIETVL